jgi:hypothetical protein
MNIKQRAKKPTSCGKGIPQEVNERHGKVNKRGTNILTAGISDHKEVRTIIEALTYYSQG